MKLTELEEILKYWRYKYPRVDVNLWSAQDGEKYFGRMTSHEGSIELNADTIGALINQGEAFLRKYK